MLEVDVVIVGAGVAGLTTARDLLRATPDLQCVVIETQSRIGGRCFGDAGASWLHGVEGNPLLEDSVLCPDDLSPATAHNIWLRGPALSDLCNFHPTETENAAWDARLMRLTQKATKGVQISLAEALAEDEPLSEADVRRCRWMQMWFGAPADQVLLLEWDNAGHFGDYAGPHMVVQGGCSTIPQRLFAAIEGRVELQLGTEVQSLEEKDSGCVVRTSGQDYYAAAVVVTVSLGVLKQRVAHDWISPLPHTLLGAIERLEMCCYNKVILTLTEEVVAAFDTWTYLDHEYFWMAFSYWYCARKPTMVLISIMAEAETLSNEEATKVAVDLLGIDRQAVVEMQMTRWSRVEWAAGAYSTFSKGCAWDDITAFEDAMCGRRMQFAGEHTHEEHQGSVHAAYLSGRRAAATVTTLLPTFAHKRRPP